MRTLRYLLIAGALLVGLAAPAAAQIYTWRDGNGNLVASDHPPQGTERSYKVSGTPFLATRPAERRYAASYDDLIAKHAATYDVSPKLVRAVMQVESGFNPRAVSRKGAAGLMQLMPATAVEMGVRNVFDPDQNIRGGVAYLRQLLNRFGGNEQLALAAYNAGPEAVARYGQTVPPYKETRNYVAQVTGNPVKSPVARPVVRGKRTAALAAAAAASVPPGRIYKFWERTGDGRLIRKFSDTKPEAGPYEIVR